MNTRGGAKPVLRTFANDSPDGVFLMGWHDEEKRLLVEVLTLVGRDSPLADPPAMEAVGRCCVGAGSGAGEVEVGAAEGSSGEGALGGDCVRQSAELLGLFLRGGALVLVRSTESASSVLLAVAVVAVVEEEVEVEPVGTRRDEAGRAATVLVVVDVGGVVGAKGWSRSGKGAMAEYECHCRDAADGVELSTGIASWPPVRLLYVWDSGMGGGGRRGDGVQQRSQGRASVADKINLRRFGCG
jgi:hypothetical protein